MSKYILLTNHRGDTLALNSEKVLAVESTNQTLDTTIKSLVITGNWNVEVREPVAQILEKLNNVSDIYARTHR